MTDEEILQVKDALTKIKKAETILACSSDWSITEAEYEAQQACEYVEKAADILHDLVTP